VLQRWRIDDWFIEKGKPVPRDFKLRELSPQASVLAQADEGAMAQMPGVRPFDERDLAHAARNSAKPNAARCGSRLSSTPSQSRRAPVYQDCESAGCGSDEANRKSALTRCMTDVQVQLAFILSSRQFRPPAGTEKRCVARAVGPAWASAAGRVSASHHLQIEAALGQGCRQAQPQ
jgi:hypothetical protein